MTVQESEPPNLRLLILAVILLLKDTHDEVEATDTLAGDTRLRLLALHAAAERYKELKL